MFTRAHLYTLQVCALSEGSCRGLICLATANRGATLPYGQCPTPCGLCGQAHSKRRGAPVRKVWTCRPKGVDGVAIYHCSIKIISRGKGKSAVASAAYRSGESLTNDYDGVTHDFTRKRGIVYTEILLPTHAPPEFSDRSALWNSVEKIEKAKNSQLAREVEVALPVELDREQQIQLVREYVKENFVSVGMCVDFAIHDKLDGNPHAHIMLTMRPLTESGGWGAKSKKEYILDKDGQRVKLKNGTFKSRKISTVDWNDKEKAETWRKAWAEAANRCLAEQNLTERIDHRSYERQGNGKIPTVHMGAAVTQMEKRGIVTERGGQNREIREQNRLLIEMRRQISRLTAWIRQMAMQERENPSITPIQSNQNPSPTLLEYLNGTIQESNVPQSNYGKARDLGLYAKSVSFLQENGIETLAQFQNVIAEMKKHYRDTYGQIKHTEKKIHERKELIDQSRKYLKHRPVYTEYKRTKPRKRDSYYKQHTAELILYQTAERYLKKHLGNNNILDLKGWKAEVFALESERNRLYDKAHRLKEKVEEAETVKKCVEQAIHVEPTKVQTKTRRRNIEL